MVYFTTNLAVDGLLAYIFIGSSLRDKFLHSNWTKALFLFANFFAIISDFDVFVGVLLGIKDHRGQSHSIIFPLVFIIIGLILLLVNRIQAKKITSSLNDIGSLFDKRKSNNTKGQILYLLPYFFILISFYWGMHLVLDMDSYEGGMMLLWPFDNTLYQVFLNFKFSPFPFVILPWTPLGASLTYQQSNPSGLFNYLFNWTPQQLIQYYHSTTFQYIFVGFVLNVLLIVIWLYFIVKPFWPFQNVKLQRKIKIFSVFTKVKVYWKNISKELLVAGIILALIGFTLGPLITPTVINNQQLNDNVEFKGNTINAFSVITIDAINQPLDPNAQFSLSIHYNLTNLHTGDQLYFVVAPQTFFVSIGQKISSVISNFNTNTKATNATIFKNDYVSTVDSSVTNQSTIFYVVQQTNQTNFSYNIHLKTSDAYGMGFILKNWVSEPLINETNTQLYINGNYSINYTRTINYWLGIGIESIGMIFVVLALVLPFKKSYNKQTSIIE